MKMYEDLMLLALDSDGFGGMIALMIISGVVALVCMCISVISMLSSKWKTASEFSINTALFGFPWVMINPVIIVLVILYPVLVCSAAHFIESKKKLASEQAETSESENSTNENK